MCGSSDSSRRTGRGPDLARLRRIAVETQRRGHHAFGLAWLGAMGPSIPSSARAPPRPTWATWTPAAARRW